VKWITHIFNQLPDQGSTTLVGELDGQIVGFASVVPSRDNYTRTRQLLNFGGSTWIPRTGGPDMDTPCTPKPWTSHEHPGQPPQPCGF
jgi:hypothetical protein